MIIINNVNILLLMLSDPCLSLHMRQDVRIQRSSLPSPRTDQRARGRNPGTRQHMAPPQGPKSIMRPTRRQRRESTIRSCSRRNGTSSCCCNKCNSSSRSNTNSMSSSSSGYSSGTNSVYSGSADEQIRDRKQHDISEHTDDQMTIDPSHTERMRERTRSRSSSVASLVDTLAKMERQQQRAERKQKKLYELNMGIEYVVTQIANIAMMCDVVVVVDDDDDFSH